MGKVFKIVLALFFVFVTTQKSFAEEEYRVLVLPDNIQFDSTNYYVYPDTATIFASDIINEIKKDGRLKTVSMTEVRDSLRKSTKLNILTKKALKEYKYNYNIPFVDFKSIAKNFNTNKVLVITSQTDTQNYLLRRTVWDVLNIPGAAVIDPAYKLSTYAALIDVDTEQVLWQSTYYKTIASVENRMIPIGFAPATTQLEKIKFYSQYMLSPMVAQIVEGKILPPPLLLPNGKPAGNNPIIDVSNKTSNEVIIPPMIELEFKHKQTVPERTDNQDNGVIINDI